MSIYKMSKIILALLLAAGIGTSAAWAKSYTYEYKYDDNTQTWAWNFTSNEEGSGLTVIYPDYSNSVDIVGETYTYTTEDGNGTTYEVSYKTIDTDSMTPVSKSVTIETDLKLGEGTNSYDGTLPTVTLGGQNNQVSFTFSYDGDLQKTGISNTSGTTYTNTDGSTTITGVFADMTGSNNHAIYNSGDGSVIDTITAGFINDSMSSTSATDDGAAICNENGATINLITGSYFLGDKATFSSSSQTEFGHGGAIYNNGTIGTIEKSYFIGDSITSNSNRTFGGAISNYEGGTIGSVSENIFLGNSAVYGGAISSGDDNNSYYDNTCEINEIIGNIFVGNAATKYTSGSSSLGGEGGAIYNYTQGTIEIISDCTFIDNSAYRDGGAIYNFGSIGSITNSIFVNNVAGEEGASGDIFGGAIYSGDDIESITGCYFDGNEVINGDGGAIAVKGTSSSIGSIEDCIFVNNAAGINGGAIYASESKIGSIKNSIFVKNTTNSSTQYAGGGAIYSNAATNIITDITGCYFVENEAIAGIGGAIYNYFGVIENIEDSYFIGNTSSTVDGNYNDNGGRGGAINNDGSVMGSEIQRISGSYFVGNTADLYGGAIYNNNNGQIWSIEGSYFLENEAKAGNGGAIENAWATSFIGSISGSVFIGNTANLDSDRADVTGWGGAIYNEGVLGNGCYIFRDEHYEPGTYITISGDGISDCVFIGNVASASGGAIFNRYQESESINQVATISNITGSYFIGNEADRGGAIYNDENTVIGGYYGYEEWGAMYSPSDVLTVSGGISDSYFYGNVAHLYGGAIYNNNGGQILSITNNYFEANVAEGGNGGAIENGYSESSIGDISGNTFYQNIVETGDHGGGAIYSEGLTTTIAKNNFVENTSGNFGGAIYNNGGSIGGNSGAIEENYFYGNVSNRGGAFYNTVTRSVVDTSENASENDKTLSSLEITETFDLAGLNSAEGSGTIFSITGNTFMYNVANNFGGAIYNYHGGDIGAISDNLFYGNEAKGGNGGAVENAEFDTSIGTMDNNVFAYNKSANNGGAIYNQGTIGIDPSSGEATDDGAITNSTFVGNEAKSGGAIYNNYGTSTVYFYDVENSEYATSVGASLVTDTSDANIKGDPITSTDASGETTSTDTYLYTTTIAGAGAIGNISNCYFEGNKATEGSGGAIYNASGTVKDSDGNEVTDAEGNSITYTTTIGKITNTSFVNNSATDVGGAIYSASDLTIAADGNLSGSTVLIQGNTASNGTDDNAIYMAIDQTTGKAGDLTFSLSNGGTIYLFDNIKGETGTDEDTGDAVGYNVVITGTGTDNKFFLLNDVNAVSDTSDVTPASTLTAGDNTNNADLSIGGVSLYTTQYTLSDEVHTYKTNSFTVTENFDMYADVDFENEVMDHFETSDDNNGTGLLTDENTGDLLNGNGHSGTLNVAGMNGLTDTDADRVAVYFAEDGLKMNVTSSAGTVYAPIYTYNANYVYLDGEGDDQKIYYDGEEVAYVSDSELFSSSDENGGYFVFDKTGFNSAVMATPIAVMGAYNAMGMMFEYNFEHSDYFMKLPEEVRIVKKKEEEEARKVAQVAESDPTKPAYYNRHELAYRGAWSRSFFSNESVDYGGGWDSRDKYYGSMVGFDTDVKVHKNGWANVTTGYAGTMGIRQQFSGGHIKQHGGFVGITETFYKKNFYNAWTIAAGFTKAHEHTMYGHDKDRIDTYGAAGRIGWNFDFHDAKFSLLPTFTASFTYVHPEDFTNAAGTNIHGSGFRAVQLNPNLKFIMNMKNGWQPYLTVGEVWTVGDRAHLYADKYKLPELDLDSYTEYGIGVQKRWAYDRDAYIQFLGHSHGRDGFLVNAGIRWNF